MAETSTGEGVFRFTDLPGEQRNSVYRHLFDDITTPDKPFHIWKEREGLPRHENLVTYRSLILTSHQLRAEGSSLFEKEYLPSLTLYFDSLSKLWNLTHPTTDNNLKRSGTQLVIRSPSDDGHFLRYEVAYLMFAESPENQLFPLLPLKNHWPYVDKAKKVRSWKRDGEVVGKALMHGGIEYESRKLLAPSSEHMGVCFTRKIGRQGESTMMVQGRFHGVEWRGSDAAGERKENSSATRASVIEGIDTVWRVRRAERERNMVSSWEEVHSPPSMEELW